MTGSQIEQHLIEKLIDLKYAYRPIDELFILETRKIDLPKAHKKGLMRQIFPSIDGVTK